MKTQNLTSYFLEARSFLPQWSLQNTDLLAAIVKFVPNSRIDWEWETGEFWASVFIEEKWIGTIRSDIAIAFFLEEYSPFMVELMAEYGVKLIVVKDFETKEFKLDREKCDRLFVEFRNGEAVDLERLSIADLWWATI
ncbi:MAG: hypothetical protein J7647_18165 [Cyanobacteria bacterium SBLK]|nr:hypothetical protein [Cyanobacteria bacterium SBLK]